MTGHPTADRTALMVLGMHRSGTSALAGTLVRLGAEAPRTLMPPNDANPLGFWESEALATFHDRLLEDAGSSWDAWTPVPDRFTQHHETALAELIESEFGDAALMVVKDPRLCRIVPLWLRVFGTLGIRPVALLVTRAPGEVCESLARREGLPHGFAALMWLRHVLDAESATRSLPRVVLDYGGLLSDWRRVVTGVAADHGVCWPVGVELAGADVDHFLRPSLRHHRAQPHADGFDEPMRGWVARAERALTILQTPAAEGSSTALAELDEIRSSLDALGAMGRVDEAAHRTRLGRDAGWRGLQLRAESAEARVGVLEGSLRKAADDHARLEARAHALQDALAVERQTRVRLEHLATEQAALLAEQAAAVSTLLGRVDAVLSSRSWRITAPLRAALDVFMRVAKR